MKSKLEILNKELDLIEEETREYFDIVRIRIEKILMKSMDHTKWNKK